jgi:hypothetical protein
MDSSNPNSAALKTQIERWRKDPVAYVNRVFGVDPEPEQASILRAFANPGAKVAVKAGHGVGKTTSAAWAALWMVPLFRDCKVAATAPSAHQLRDVLMAEIGKWLQRAHPWLRSQLTLHSMRLEVKGAEATQFLTARTARPESPDALQGLHAENMAYIIEEAFGVADPIFEVARGALSTRNSRALLIGNPTATSGYAYNAFHKNAAMWNRFTLSCVNSKLADPEYAKEMAQEYGEESDVYRVRVLGEFPTAAINQLIPRMIAEAAAARKFREDQVAFAPKVIGVDPAWEGDDRSVIVLRQGLSAQCLGVFSKMDNMTLGGLVDQLWTKHGADQVFIDVGWGAGVIDFLRGLGRSPMPINFGGTALDAQYANRRTEMWFLMRDWLEEGGGTWPKEDLIDDLTGPMYFFMPNGKKLLERKKDMKKRGLRSPDIADALALTFAAPVSTTRRYSPSGVPKPGTAMASIDYDIFS